VKFLETFHDVSSVQEAKEAEDKVMDKYLAL